MSGIQHLAANGTRNVQVMHMTSNTLQTIRSREKGATNGPWRVDRMLNLASSTAGDKRTYPAVRGFRAPRKLYELAWEQLELDAAFMAHAREDVPSLLDEVEHLRRVLKRCKETVSNTDPSAPDAAVQISAAIDAIVSAEEGRWDGPVPTVTRKLVLPRIEMRRPGAPSARPSAPA